MDLVKRNNRIDAIQYNLMVQEDTGQEVEDVLRKKMNMGEKMDFGKGVLFAFILMFIIIDLVIIGFALYQAITSGNINIFLSLAFVIITFILCLLFLFLINNFKSKTISIFGLITTILFLLFLIAFVIYVLFLVFAKKELSANLFLIGTILFFCFIFCFSLYFKTKPEKLILEQKND